MQVRVRRDDTKIAVIVDLENFTTSSPHRDLVLAGNMNHWSCRDDAYRFPWSQDANHRAFQPLRFELPDSSDLLEFKLFDSVREEWIEPYGYLTSAYAGMEPFFAENSFGSFNIRYPLRNT